MRATRVVTLLAGQSILAALAAQEAAAHGSLPTCYASNLLAVTPEGAETITDPKTGKAYTAAAHETLYGNGNLADMVVTTGGDALCYFAQDDKPGGPARVL